MPQLCDIDLTHIKQKEDSYGTLQFAHYMLLHNIYGI